MSPFFGVDGLDFGVAEVAIGFAELFWRLEGQKLFVPLVRTHARKREIESFVKFKFLRDDFVVSAGFFAD